jgi:hypothetical protein
MKNLVRFGLALSTVVGVSALVGTQAVGASPTKSYLGVYEALNQTVTSLNIEFTVPKFKCESANDAVDAYANTFDQTPGNPDAFDGGFVQLSCSAAKKPVITPFLEADGTYVSPSGMTIVKKDVIDISVTCGASAGSDTIDDVTSGQSESFPTAAGSSCNGAFLGNIGVSNKKGTKDLALPTFGSIHFSDATLNGAPLGDASPAAKAVNYYEGASNVIKVGPLTGGTAWVNTQES